MPTETTTNGSADLLRTLANAHRLQILSVLSGGELSVGDLQALIPLTQSALSQHLARLRAQHIVATRRSAQSVFYRIADDQALAMAKALLLLVSRRAEGGRVENGARSP
jgi:ArsR family transcriptional regulator